MTFGTPRRAALHILVAADTLTVIGSIEAGNVQFVGLLEQDPLVAGTAGLVALDPGGVVVAV